MPEITSTLTLKYKSPTHSEYCADIGFTEDIEENGQLLRAAFVMLRETLVNEGVINRDELPPQSFSALYRRP